MFLTRAHSWYAAAGITIERVISDNCGCYPSRLWAETCARLDITPKRTRPYRPQTNGKVERFHRTLAGEWAYARPYATETERRAALDPGCICTTITAVLSGSSRCCTTWRLNVSRRGLQHLSHVWCTLSSLLRARLTMDVQHMHTASRSR